MISGFSGRAAVILCGAAVVWTTSCGMRPPPEYNEASEAQDVDLRPFPAAEDDADAGARDPADASPDGPGMGTLSLALPWGAIPSMPIALLLGKSRADIETLVSPVKPESKEERAVMRKEAKEGWTRYTANLRIRYEDADVAVELEQQVPSELSCVEAAKWLGFADAESPTEADGRCVWSAGKGGAKLGGGESGDLDRKSSIFRASKPFPKTP
jgi:hypothetical protein